MPDMLIGRLAGSQTRDDTDVVPGLLPPNWLDGAAGAVFDVEGCRTAGVAPSGAGGASACGFGSCTGLYMAVRRIGGEECPAYVHMVYRVLAARVMKRRFRRSGVVWRCRQERSVKPSAQPTLVRTQHLPPPAKTARSLRKRGPAGRFLLVPLCVIVCRRRSWRSDCYGHMADSVQAEGAVRGTACFADPRPFRHVSWAPGLLV